MGRFGSTSRIAQLDSFYLEDIFLPLQTDENWLREESIHIVGREGYGLTHLPASQAKPGKWLELPKSSKSSCTASVGEE